MYWFHCQQNGTPERLTDEHGTLRWEGETGSWGKLVRENPVRAAGFAQNLRIQGQYPDRDKSVGNGFEQRVSAGPKGGSQGGGE